MQDVSAADSRLANLFACARTAQSPSVSIAIIAPACSWRAACGLFGGGEVGGGPVDGVGAVMGSGVGRWLETGGC